MVTEEAEGTGVSEERRRAVFLDRDGTIIADADYLNRADQIRLLPGAAAALKRLREAGFLLVVVTNQSAIARGWLTEEELADIHAALDRLLAASGAAVDAYYHCPHLPDAPVKRYAVACRCRKPQPGLIERAALELGLDPRRCYAVGDSERDVEAGRRCGCRTVLLGAGAETAADGVAPDLEQAADLILKWEAGNA